MEVTPESLIKRSDSLMSARLGDFESGTVVLNKSTNAYFGLDGVAAFIWEQLDEPLAFAEVVKRVVDVYDVDTDRAEDDAKSFIIRLIEKGLVDLA